MFIQIYLLSKEIFFPQCVISPFLSSSSFLHWFQNEPLCNSINSKADKRQSLMNCSTHRNCQMKSIRNQNGVSKEPLRNCSTNTASCKPVSIPCFKRHKCKLPAYAGSLCMKPLLETVLLFGLETVPDGEADGKMFYVFLVASRSLEFGSGV